MVFLISGSSLGYFLSRVAHPILIDQDLWKYLLGEGLQEVVDRPGDATVETISRVILGGPHSLDVVMENLREVFGTILSEHGTIYKNDTAPNVWVYTPNNANAEDFMAPIDEPPAPTPEQGFHPWTKDHKELKVYGVPRSPPTRAILWLLTLQKHPFRLIETIPGSKQPNGSRDGDFLEKFPNGVIPTIEDEETGVCIGESNAIMAYLCTQYKWSHLYPYDDLPARTKVDEMLHWHHTNTRTITTAIMPFLNPSMASSLPGEYLEIQKKMAVKALKLLEKRLDGKKFLCGDTMTIADLCIYADVGQISPRWSISSDLTGLDVDFGDMRCVWRWFIRMENEREYDFVHEDYRMFVRSKKSQYQWQQPRHPYYL